MIRLTRAPFLILVLGALSSALGACQALAGIDDRSYDLDLCKQYCDLAQSVCTGTSQIYSTPDTCNGVCHLLAPGDPNEPTGDTVACRINQLQLAEATNEPNSAATYCPHAGPATNGACASNCDTYCSLFHAACPSQIVPDDCQQKCLGLEDTGSFDVNANYYNDTLQCRFVHISVATIMPSEHCPHAALPANGPCLGMEPANVVPDCDSFCHLEMTECSGSLQQYETPQQCQDVCNALDKGTADDQSGNTVACRKYHSYNALLDPTTHCPHTGPGGEGVCGSPATPDSGTTGNCDSYCLLLEKACKSQFDSLGGQDGCEAVCVKLDGAAPNSTYSIAANGDNLQCRLLHVSRAFEDATECGAATGDAPCD
ncbi:MAG TPA: hypothetical protein VGM44_24970 [Polyangiaceae bacterium]|jgi:hypothetical protein